MVPRGEVICKAIDTNRYVYTYPDDGDVTDGKESRAAYEQRILKDFQQYFENSSTINTLPKLLRLVNSSKQVAEWYKYWNTSRATDNLTPEWLPKDTKSQAAWVEANKASTAFKAKETGWNTLIKEASDSLKATVKQVTEERKAYIETLPNLLIIDKVSINELPYEQQLQLAVIESDEIRSEKGKELLLDFKVKLYRAHIGNNFQNPFG